MEFRSRILRLLFLYLETKGIAAHTLIERHSLPTDAASAPWVSLEITALQAVFADAASRAADPFLGVHLAQLFERGTFGLLEYCSRNAPTFAEGAKRVARYMVLVNELAKTSWKSGTFRHEITGSRECLGRHVNEMIVGSILIETRKLTQHAFVPERVFFAHARPDDTSELEALLGTSNIEFGREGIGFVVPRDLWDLPFVPADGALLSILDEQASTLVASRPNDADPFLVRVRRSIERKMIGEAPSLAAVADDLHLSVRTLQRRLGDENTSFGAQVEAVREELARIHVRENKLPLGEIAFVLGYAHVSTFLRAFKRWTGKTPTQFRT